MEVNDRRLSRAGILFGPRIGCCGVLAGVFRQPIWIRLLLAVILTAGADPAMAVGRNESLIPFDKLDPAALALVRQVVPGYTFYRKLHIPYDEFAARRDVFEYLGDHLDLTSILGQPLNVVRFRCERMPDGSFWADNQAGASGFLWPLYAAPGERMFFVQGSDRSSKAVEGCSVVLVRYHESGPGLIRCEIHAFVKVKGAMKRFLAGLFLPLVTGTVDRRFGEVLSIPVLVSEEASLDPAKVVAVIDSLPPEDAAKLGELRALLSKQPPKPQITLSSHATSSCRAPGADPPAARRSVADGPQDLLASELTKTRLARSPPALPLSRNAGR